MTLQYSMTKYIIYDLFTVVYFAQKQSISTYILGNILASVVYFATCTVHLISVHATNFHLKITSQNIVRKKHEQVYYAYLITTGTLRFSDLPTAL